MPNSVAAVRVAITAGARSVSKQNAPAYAALSDGTVDIPDATPAATEFAIPFGAVTDATMLYVENKSGQDMTPKINGAAVNRDHDRA